MSDKFKNENQIVKTHAQASGKLKKRPLGHSRTGEAQPQQQGQNPQSSHQRQRQQGDAFGSVGIKPEPKREKREVVDL